MFIGVIKAALQDETIPFFFQNQKVTLIMFLTISSELNASFLINNKRSF